MKMKKLVMLVASLMFLATSAYAENRVEVKVTSEPIKEDSTCDKAGGFTLEFDPGTEMIVGDTITMDTTLYTTLCKDVLEDGKSLYIVQGDDAPLAGSMQWAGATVAADTVFKVRGLKGTQRVTVSLVDGSVSVPNVPDNYFLIKFLEQSTNTDLVKATDYDPVTNTFEDAETVTVPDNTLCIDVSDERFTASVVRGSMDSKGDKFTFIPSDPQIAHIVAKDSYTLVQCTKPELGEVCPGEIAGQGGVDSCAGFDYDGATAQGATGINDPNGDNLNTPYNNRLILRADPGFDAATDYYVEMTILVNGLAGDHGVYFAENTIGYANESLYRNLADLCAEAAVTPGLATTAYLPTGRTGTVVAAGTDCLVNASNRVVKLKSATGAMGISAGDELLKLNVPAMRYDINVVNLGDVISLKVDLKKAPCTDVTSQTLPIATIACPAEAGTSYNLTYPYFTQMSGDNWWDGIVITNLDSAAGTAALTVYEQDGDKGTFTTPSVPAYSMYVSTLDSIAFAADAGNAGSLGDSRAWIKAVTTFNADGFAMIAEPGTGQSMGYLPRKAGYYQD